MPSSIACERGLLIQPGFGEVAACLAAADPRVKCARVAALWDGVRDGGLDLDPARNPGPPAQPGRPPAPELVEPARVPRRRLGSQAGRAALVHAIAHIEFNAINLALDATLRFPGMPGAYYTDWVSVAADEARHFRMLEERLHQLGHDYGDFPAHNGLWEMAEKTAGSCLERMALVPRVLEARGLDVTPGMMTRLRAVDDHRTVAVLEVILEEEVRHVEIGSRWFAHCCAQAGLDPEQAFLDLLQRHFGGSLRGPFNRDARLQAGFTARELAAMEAGG